MQGDLEIVLNTHSSCNDVIAVFVGQLEKHWPTHPPVVVGHDCHRVLLGLRNYRLVDYSPANTFSSQYLMMLAAVHAPYCLTAQDDFILYADVDEAAIRDAIEVIECDGFASARLIDSGRELQYSMQASVWCTCLLRQLYARVYADTPWEAEVTADRVMRQMPFGCRHRYDDHLPMRGRNHRDSEVFPYVSTAIVRGKWNHEYRTELTPLLAEYGIDAKLRGWTT